MKINHDHWPGLTVNASENCSFHDDVPMSKEAFALCTNLSTVFWNENHKIMREKKWWMVRMNMW